MTTVVATDSIRGARSPILLTEDEIAAVAGGRAPWVPDVSRRDFPPRGDQPSVPQPLPSPPQVPPGSYVP